MHKAIEISLKICIDLKEIKIKRLKIESNYYKIGK